MTTKSRVRSKKQKHCCTKKSCRIALSKKIKQNMEEYRQGRYSSKAQAIAVSYSQISKKKPRCKHYFRRS